LAIDETLGRARINVEYDISQLDAQERAIRQRAERLIQETDARLKASSDKPASGSPSVGGGAAPGTPAGAGGGGDGTEVASILSTTISGVGRSITTGIERQRAALEASLVEVARTQDAAVDMLASIDERMKTVEKASDEQVKTRVDFLRAEKQASARAALNQRVAEIAAGPITGNRVTRFASRQLGTETDPERLISSRVSVESRSTGGVGFGGGEGGGGAGIDAAALKASIEGAFRTATKDLGKQVGLAVGAQLRLAVGRIEATAKAVLPPLMGQVSQAIERTFGSAPEAVRDAVKDITPQLSSAAETASQEAKQEGENLGQAGREAVLPLFRELQEAVEQAAKDAKARLEREQEFLSSAKTRTGKGAEGTIEIQRTRKGPGRDRPATTFGDFRKALGDIGREGPVTAQLIPGLTPAVIKAVTVGAKALIQGGIKTGKTLIQAGKATGTEIVDRAGEMAEDTGAAIERAVGEQRRSMAEARQGPGLAQRARGAVAGFVGRQRANAAGAASRAPAIAGGARRVVPAVKGGLISASLGGVPGATAALSGLIAVEKTLISTTASAVGTLASFGPSLGTIAGAAQLAAPAAIGLSTAILGVGNTVNLIRAPFDKAGNFIRGLEDSFTAFKFGPLTGSFLSVGKSIARGVTFPLRLAGRGIKLFDNRASATTNVLRLLGLAARPLKRLLRTPFLVALTPVKGLTVAVKGLKNSLAALGLALVLNGIRALKNAFATAIGGAAEMETTIRRVDRAFGEAAEGPKKLASDLAQNFGFVEQKALDLQSQIGLLFKGVGVEDEPAADIASELTERAADISSVFGAELGSVKDSLTSALTGNFTPLRKFDILLSAAEVKQRAVALGLAESTDGVNEQAKALALHNLIMEKSGQFAGALGANSTTLANQFQELKGRITNLVQGIGATLAPAVRELILLFNDIFISAGEQGAGGALADFGAGVLERIQQAIRVVRLFVANWQAVPEATRIAFEGMKEAFISGVEFFRDLMTNFFDWFFSNWQSIVKDIGNITLTLFKNLGSNLKNFSSALLDFFKDPRKGFNFETVGLLEGFEPKTEDLFEIPELDLGLDETASRFRDLLATIEDTPLRGDDEAPIEREQNEANEMLSGLEEEAKKQNESGRLVDAAQLRDLQQKSAFEKKQQQTAERTEQNTERAANSLEQIAQRMNNGLGGVAVAAS